MAFPGHTSKFRIALLKSSKLLTEANVKDLTFICEQIPPARREKITNGIELFAELQGHDLLSKDDVTTMIEWMEELQLAEAVKPLKEYRQRYVTAGVTERTQMNDGNSWDMQPSKTSGNARNQSADVVLQQQCLLHQGHPLTYVCVPCDMEICSECVITSHNPGTTCDVIKIDQIEAETITRGDQLLKQIKGALSHVNASKEQWEEKKKKIFEKLDTKDISDFNRLFEERIQIERLKNNVEHLKKTREGSTGSGLQELQKITKAKEEVSGVDELAVMPLTILVGSVSLSKETMINVSDGRRNDGGVLLVRIDPCDPNKECWRHTVDTDDRTAPVVMSYRGMWYNGTNHALFAVGKTVYIVRPRWTGSGHDSVESVSSLEIGDVPEGCWISSITGCYKPVGEPKTEFLISVAGSSVLREYNVSGSLRRYIETKDYIPSGGITCVAYNTNTIAIIGPERNDVILLSADGTAKCGSLKPPSGNLLPLIVLFVGSRGWMVLYNNSWVEKEWKVVEYNITGELVKICEEVTSSSDLDVPVSITRYMYTGYVTLSNNTVRTFQY